MKQWQLIGLMTLPVVLFAAFYLYHQQQLNNAPVVTHKPAQRLTTQDETVVPKKLFIDSVASAKVLVGKPVWLQAGYQVEYFPYRSKHIDFAHQMGVLPAAEELTVQDVIAQAAPATFNSRQGRGDRNVFMIFTEPGSTDEYAAPMATIGGAVGAGESKYYFDDLLYYDDPHQLYKFWPADTWKAVDAHQVIAGMNELQTTMALGQIQQSGSPNYGNRTVHFIYGEHNEKQASVTFVDNKATEIKGS